MTEQQIQIPPGLLVLTSYGSVTMETTRAWAELRSFNDRQGLLNVGYDIIPGGLVEKARNDAVRRALQMGAQWLGMLDADMTFQPDAWLKILQTAYGHTPWFDVVGGYCSLRGEMALPTIDTGTGTWESHYPNSGILEVIRTGAACLLVKRHVFERIPDPWFRMRVPSRPLDFMAEVDNFARIKFDGRNPFRGSQTVRGRSWRNALDKTRAVRDSGCLRRWGKIRPSAISPKATAFGSGWIPT